MAHGKHKSEEASPESVRAGYEIRDVNTSVLVIGVTALVLLCAGSIMLMYAMFKGFEQLPSRTGEAPPPIDYGRLLPPEPRLQPDPPRDLEEFLASEDKFLESYIWINRDEGVVKIPIGSAMDIVAERGLPSWPAVEAGEPAVATDVRPTAPEPVDNAEPAAGTGQADGESQ